MSESAEYFQIALPIPRDEFIALYKQVSHITKLIFAPFGLHEHTGTLLGASKAQEVYTSTYQQIEDAVSKAVFKLQGVDDDQIVASMHEYVGRAQQDEQVIKGSVGFIASDDPVLTRCVPGDGRDHLITDLIEHPLAPAEGGGAAPRGPPARVGGNPIRPRGAMFIARARCHAGIARCTAVSGDGGNKRQLWFFRAKTRLFRGPSDAFLHSSRIRDDHDAVLGGTGRAVL